MQRLVDIEQFLSTPSARRATTPLLTPLLSILISIHALREEGDQGGQPDRQAHAISIHALREEGDPIRASTSRSEAISIHALREEGDAPRLVDQQKRPRISIHALREEGDYEPRVQLSDSDLFLSTPSARRATARSRRSRPAQEDFYPRPPRGGRPGRFASLLHLLAISIHALREEGDSWGFPELREYLHFYPRPPRGGRRRTAAALAATRRFLSTPSARRATYW